ncbi:MAG: FAD-dependent monooxygenase [Trebonia sp.]
MSVEGSRVAVIGGSIAGCAAAIALTRAGCDVTVYERARGTLQERGFGIGIPAGLHDELVSSGYLDNSTPACRYSERAWFVADASGTGQGRLLATQSSPIACENWAVLWNSLHAKVPGGAYRSGVAVTEVHASGHRPTLAFDEGGSERFDLVIGADGYRSTVRHLIAPGAVPLPAGYGLWRATCPEDTVPEPARRMLKHTAFMVAFPGGHAGGYLIPDHARPGGRLLNWYVYIVPPTPFTDLRIMLPGDVDDPLLDLLDDVLASFPPLWRETFRCTDRDRVSVQPLYDLTVPSYVSGRFVVLGDAGAVARTHTASGATTALLDALALERWCRTGRGWDEMLDGYNQERCPAGNEQTELGRVLGQAQVTGAPDWQGMSPADFREWWRHLVSARRTFLDG